MTLVEMGWGYTYKGTINNCLDDAIAECRKWGKSVINQLINEKENRKMTARMTMEKIIELVHLTNVSNIKGIEIYFENNYTKHSITKTNKYFHHRYHEKHDYTECYDKTFPTIESLWNSVENHAKKVYDITFIYTR